jgi:hypothetical protein
MARDMLLGLPHREVEKPVMPVVPPPLLPKVEPATQP